MPWNNDQTTIYTTALPASSQPQTGGGSTSANNAALTPITKRHTDPNMTDSRLLANRRCIYERPLPGDAYITAHVERLQHGYFESANTTDPPIAHVDFLAINFVLHPSDSQHHRFKAATIKVSVQNFLGDFVEKDGRRAYPYPQEEHPKFLMHAPHLIYGAVSPENLQWTFSLAGSLGISETPVGASLRPSGRTVRSYKIYEMMKIQGSARTWKSPHGLEFDIEDGEISWSLSENDLQRSGLPREFTFVFLVQKPRSDSRVKLSLHIDPVIDVWYGRFPAWWLNQSRYQPMPKRAVNFRHEVGQRFEPVTSSRGFNFASLASTFDDYVNMPGSTYSSNVSPDGVYNDPNSPLMKQPSRSNSRSKRSSQPNYSQPPNSQQTQDPSDFWQVHSPFQQGWPRQSQYPGNPFGQSTRQMGEALGALDGGTVNVNVMLDRNISSQIASAVLAAHRSPRVSPVPRRSPGLGGSPVPRGSPALQGSPLGRTRSLRRTKSRDKLNQSKASRRLAAPPALVTTDSNNPYESTGFNRTDGASDAPDVTITPSRTAVTIPNSTGYTPATKEFTPRSNDWSGKTATSAMNGNLTPFGVDTSPLDGGGASGSHGIQRQQSVSAGGPRPRHSSSSKPNGQRDRYSYPSGLV